MGRGGMPSQVYGPIHLLRLFVRLPQFLFRAQLPPGNVNLLHLHFRDLLGYVLGSAFICSAYIQYLCAYIHEVKIGSIIF